jgi:hypothetical protein
MLTAEENALTVEELIQALERQNRPAAKVKINGRFAVRLKYTNSAGKPFVEIITG